MMILRFRDSIESEELTKKIKKIKKLAEEVEDCLGEAVEEPEYRDTRYHRDYDEDDDRMRGRYGYSRR